MIRRELLQGAPYNDGFRHAEDYELWGRLLLAAKFANLPEVLLRYRVWSQQICSAKRELQSSRTFDAACNFLRELSVAEPVKRKAGIAHLRFADRPGIDEIDSVFREIHDLCEKKLGKEIYPCEFVIGRFVSCVFKASKIMFTKNILFSRYLGENKSRRRALAVVFRKAAKKLASKLGVSI
jgi:hypothetical protein